MVIELIESSPDFADLDDGVDEKGEVEDGKTKYLELTKGVSSTSIRFSTKCNHVTDVECSVRDATHLDDVPVVYSLPCDSKLEQTGREWTQSSISFCFVSARNSLRKDEDAKVDR